MADIVIRDIDVTPAHVFGWKGGTVPGRLFVPGLPTGFEAVLHYNPATMAVTALTYQTPPGVGSIIFDVKDHKHRKTLAKLPGTQGTNVTIPLHPRFELEKRGGAAFFPAGAQVILSVG